MDGCGEGEGEESRAVAVRRECGVLDKRRMRRISLQKINRYDVRVILDEISNLRCVVRGEDELGAFDHALGHNHQVSQRRAVIDNVLVRVPLHPGGLKRAILSPPLKKKNIGHQTDVMEMY